MKDKSMHCRRIVSTALGGGLLGQFVENPLQAAGKFGIDLDQFGINKTSLENTIGFNGNPAMNNNLFSKGEILFSNQQKISTTTTPAPLFIDGKMVQPENEEVVLNAILGDKRNQNKPNNPQSSASYYSNNEKTNRVHPKRYRSKITPPPVSPEVPSTTVPTTVVPTLPNDLFVSMMPFLNTPKMESNDVIEVTEEPREFRRAPAKPGPIINQMNAKIMSLEQRLNEQQELLKKQKSEDKVLKVQKILETIKFGKSSRFSALQKQLRYSPEVDDELKLDTHPLVDTVDVECECVPVKLDTLKGKWVQVLSSENLNNKLKKSIEKMFGSDNPKLQCSQIQLSPPRDHKPEYSHFYWTLRLANSTNTVRVRDFLERLFNSY